jgi:hypothetical protein
VSENAFFAKLNVFLARKVDLRAKMLFAILLPYLSSIFLVDFIFVYYGSSPRKKPVNVRLHKQNNVSAKVFWRKKIYIKKKERESESHDSIDN